MSQLIPTESMGERRASSRQRRLHGGKIVFNNNTSSIDCVVRDLSPTGARLEVASPIGIPDWFEFANRPKWRVLSIESGLEVG